MKPVTELYDTHPESDIYVVGTGTSMRVFPVDFLAGRITIGLNRAWKTVPVKYSITLGPHTHVPEFMDGEDAHPEITWITKRGKAQAVLTPAQFAHADAHFYTFDMGGRERTQHDDWVIDTGRVLDWVRRPSGTMLYQWSSISQTACNLAANMGARNVILVGCDNSSLLGNHHAQQHHTKWLGRTPDERYQQYYEGLAEIRSALRSRGVRLLSLSPFLQLGGEEQDFLRLCGELDQAEHITPGPDISEVDHPRRFAAAGTPGTAPFARRAMRRARVLAGEALRAARSKR